MKALLPEVKVTVTHCIEDGDLAMARVKVTARDRSLSPESGLAVNLLVRVHNGRFVEFYSNFDYLQMFEQLGQIPEDTLPICLTGERLVWVE
mgnify:CR=1 FL=1